jgi:hypothetical protein
MATELSQTFLAFNAASSRNHFHRVSIPSLSESQAPNPRSKCQRLPLAHFVFGIPRLLHVHKPAALNAPQ